MKALGRHFVADFFGCSADLNNPDIIMVALEQACAVSGATIVSKTGHHFSPYGVSVMFVVAESHLAIHTWPEYKYAAVDVFTCGTSVDSDAAFQSLKSGLGATRVDLKEFPRGILTAGDFPEEASVGPNPVEVSCGP